MKKTVIARIKNDGTKEYLRVADEHAEDCQLNHGPYEEKSRTYRLRIHTTDDVRKAQDYEDTSEEGLRLIAKSFAKTIMLCECDTDIPEVVVEEVEVGESFFVAAIPGDPENWDFELIFTGLPNEPFEFGDQFCAGISKGVNHPSKESAQKVVNALSKLNDHGNIVGFKIIAGFYEDLVETYGS